MSEFVQVPVPEGLVTEVMGFIAQRSAQLHTVPQVQPTGDGREVRSPSDQPNDMPGQSRDWTREELEMLFNSEASSVQKFAQVLTILAEAAPRALTPNELGEHFGVPGIQLQRTFGPASRWMRNRMGGDVRWPITFAEDKWAMSEHNATLWKAVLRDGSK